MYCQYCGKIIDDYSTVCSKCGAPVANPKVRPGKGSQIPYPAQQAQAPAPEPAPAPAPMPQAQPDSIPKDMKVARKNKNGLGIAGFTLSILGIFLGPALIFNLVGFILSAVGVGLRHRYEKRNGLAVAGLVISLIFLLLWAAVYALAIMIIMKYGEVDMLGTLSTWDELIDWITNMFDALTAESAVAMAII